MTELLVRVLPLQLGSTLSPVIFGLTLVLLAKREYALARTFALFVGSAVVAILLALAGLKVGQNINAFGKHTIVTSIIDFILALIFIYFGIKGLIKKEGARKEKHLEEVESGQLIKWFAIGFIISATNFDAMILNFTAAKEIGGAAISFVYKSILILVGILFLTAPILVPLVLYLISPKFAQRVLEPLNVFLVKFGRYLVATIFLIFAVYLIYRGIKTL